MGGTFLKKRGLFINEMEEGGCGMERKSIGGCSLQEDRPQKE